MRKIFLFYISICLASATLYAQPVIFTAESQNVDCASNTFCVNVDVTNFVDITGMQFALQWNTADFDYSSHQFFISPSPIDVVDASAGYMAFTWFGPFTGLTLPDDEVIISLCLDVKGNAGSSSMIEFVEQPGQVIEVSNVSDGLLEIGTEVLFNTATLNITDSENPVISCPADVISATSVVTGIGPTSVSDNCAVETVSYSLSGATSGSGMNDASGTAFSNGVTAVTYTASDFAGNEHSCSFDVTVNDPNPNEKLIFDPRATLDCVNDRVTIDVHVFNFDSLVSMQFGIFWDTMIIQYLNYTELNLPNSTFITTVVDEGKMALIWTNPNPTNPAGYSIPDNTVIFQLEFDAVGPLSIPLITFDTILPLNLEIADINGRLDPSEYMFMPGTLTVNDNTPPVLSGCPADITLDATPTACGSPYVWTIPTATDDCDDNPGIVGSHSPGHFFSVGVDTVFYIATDMAGNTDTCSFMVTVNDVTNPTISCPADVTVGTDAGMCSAVVNNIAPVSSNDNCLFNVTYTISGATSNSGPNDASGTTFNPGVSTITYTNTDESGNSASCSFTVTVNDNEDPVINCPSNISVNTDAGQCNASVTVPQPTGSDNCTTFILDNDFNSTNNASGTYPVGTTTAIWTASDASGNSVSCQMTVTVSDNEPPSLTCPSDITVDITSGSSAVVNNIDPNASDACGMDNIQYVLANATTGSGTGSASGQTFNLGTTQVTYTATDQNGNTSNCTFSVTVRFVLSDIISCPGDQNDFTDTDACGTNVDNIGPIILINPSDVSSLTYTLDGATVGSGSDDASGDFFNLGATIVKYFAEDRFGNFDTCQFTIIILDNVPPTLSNCPADISMSATANCEAQLSWNAPTASDNCQIGSLSPSHSSGSTFSAGTTVVTYTATDNSGNTATCSFTVTIEDNVDPVFVNCPPDITVDAPVGACQEDASWTPPTPTDNCSITSSSSSHNPGDIFPVGGPTTVTYTATDQNGNTATCSFTVTVQDVTPPTIGNCSLNNLQLTHLDDCRAIANWSPITATDACSAVTITCTNNPGDTLPVGMTTEIICIAVDAAGNIARCTLEVDIPDTEDPVFDDCPADLIISTDPGECTATASWDVPTATDNCGFVDVTQSHSPGVILSVGTTTVTYTATDGDGNTAECIFDITIQDMVAPELSCDSIVVSVDGTIISDPGNLLSDVTADNNCQGVKLDFNVPDAQDNCEGAIAPVQTDNTGLSSGSTFPGGITLLEYTATDGSGNSATCEIKIEVVPLPSIEVSILPSNQLCAGEDITLVASSLPMGASISWSGPNNFSSMEVSPTITGITTAGAGTYTATITLANNCQTSGSQTLTIDPAPIFTASSNSPVCNGSLRLTAVPAPNSPAILDWLWEFPNQTTDNTQNPVIPNADGDFAGTYIVTATALNGCTSSDTITVQVANIPAPVLQTDCDQVLCLGQSCFLMGTEYVPSPDAYNWLADPANGAGLPANTANNEISVQPTVAGTYVYSYWVTADGCDSDTATVELNVEDNPQAVNDNYTTDSNVPLLNFDMLQNDIFNSILGITLTIPTTTINGTLTQNDDGTYTYTPNQGFIGSDMFLYEICYNCGDDPHCSTAIVNIDIQFAGGECTIPNVISPNEDGLNDELFIDCIEGLTTNNTEIQIFNEWGDEVFQAKPYFNDWQGTYEGQNLPDGTYYYIFKIDGTASPKNGYVTILR